MLSFKGGYPLFFFTGTGSCEMITAISIKPQPINSRPVIFSPRIRNPNTTAQSPSVLMMMEAAVGLACFCPSACRVKATPVDMIPVYKTEMLLPVRAAQEIGSRNIATARLMMPATKN